MKDLERLPEIADKGLGGLTAGQNLKYRIEHAAREEKAGHKPRVPVWVPAVCCALVLAVGLYFALPQVTSVPDADNAGVMLRSQRAGDATEAPRLRADLPDGSVQLSSTRGAPSYRSIWAEGGNGGFPMIGVNGRYYRMLNSPSSLNSSLLGDEVGAVSEYTTEPSLSGSDVIMSNQVAQGELVYNVSGMDGAVIAAQVDGAYRAFQRVSFNGNSVKGSETLADTLQISGHVQALELSDVGMVSDSQTASELVETLLSNASFESSSTVSGRQSLLIELDNGLTIQLAVKDDKVSACGTWSCPEFMDAFAAAAQ